MAVTKIAVPQVTLDLAQEAVCGPSLGTGALKPGRRTFADQLGLESRQGKAR